jgi:hypothetical protein
MKQNVIQAVTDNENIREYALASLMRQASPELDLLKAYVDAIKGPHYNKIDMSLLIKYGALTKSPTVMEATMTTPQLYSSGNVLWAKAYSPQMILNIWSTDQELKQQGYQNYLETLFATADEERTFVPDMERVVTRTLYELGNGEILSELYK